MKRKNRLLLLLMTMIILTGCQTNMVPDSVTGQSIVANTECPAGSTETKTVKSGIKVKDRTPEKDGVQNAFDYSQLPAYVTDICVEVNKGTPYFTEDEIQGGTSCYVSLSELGTVTK